MLIDAHSHCLAKQIIDNAHFFSPAWGDIEAQVAAMDRAGIDQAVLSYPTSDAHLKLGGAVQLSRIYNDNIAEILKRYPGRFIGAAVLPLGDERRMLDELTRASEGLGFQAVSLASSYDGIYLDDKIFTPLYKQAQKKRLPIFVHSQIINPIGFERVNDPLLTPVIEYVFDTTICVGKLLMSEILKEYADLRFIFAYFGGVVAHLAGRFDSTYSMLRGINFVKDLKNSPSHYLKNIYVDTGGDTTKTNFQAALGLFGPGHILWGSDWPAKKEIQPSIAILESLGLSQNDKENIMGRNLSGILGTDKEK